MRLLIDTHALLWFCEGNPALSAAARTAMEDGTNECFVSTVTAWEVAIKMGLGKLKLQVAYDDLFPGVLSANGFASLIPDFRHFKALITLPFHHRDPFDRLLVAQAKLEGMTLITSDADMFAYGVQVLW